MAKSLTIEERNGDMGGSPECALALPVFDVQKGPRHPALPNDVQTDFSTGLELIAVDEPRRACECFERVLEAAPRFADGHIALGMALAACSKVYPALDHLQKAAKLEPDNFFAHFKLGHLYFKLRVPRIGYHEMDRALDCATSFRERQLVAQLQREERQREHGAIKRPWWNKPFSRKFLYFAATMAATVGIVLLRFMYMH
ncbi:MAG: hypothetical protein ACRD2G_08435 [Terriglobia bacterium]